MNRLSRLSALLTRQQEWVDKNVGPWIGALLLFALLRGLLQVAGKVHWIVGLGATLALAIVLALLLLGWRQKIYAKQQQSRNDVAVLLFSTLLMAVAVFAAVSMLIFRFQPGAYTGAPEISMSTFTDYYVWLTADALPGIRFSDTFGVKRPLDHHGVIAAVCLLAFRGLVLSTLLKAFKDWLTASARPVDTKPQLSD
jgi:hypothetical protein